MNGSESYIPLDSWSMAAGTALVLVTVGISLWRRLDAERDLLVASVRCGVQLTLMGFVLRYIFRLYAWYLVAGLLAVMIAIASWEAYQHVKKPVTSTLSIIGGCMFLATVLTLVYLTHAVVRVHTWYDPQYVIPLAGMILGQAVSAAAIAAERLTSQIRESVDEIETYLALGALPRRAVQRQLRSAVNASLIPTVSAMAVAGIVKLPGMMTGQILAGADPLDAAMYQIIIFFTLAFTAGITSMLIVEMLHRQFFVDNARLRREAL